jgi:hypothetical protein
MDVPASEMPELNLTGVVSGALSAFFLFLFCSSFFVAFFVCSALPSSIFHSPTLGLPFLLPPPQSVRVASLPTPAFLIFHPLILPFAIPRLQSFLSFYLCFHSTTPFRLPLYSFILTNKPTLPASALFTPFTAPNLKAKGASGGPVLLRPGLNTKLTPGALPPPVNMTALDRTTPWQMSARTTSGGSIVECEDAGCA